MSGIFIESLKNKIITITKSFSSDEHIQIMSTLRPILNQNKAMEDIIALYFEQLCQKSCLKGEDIPTFLSPKAYYATHSNREIAAVMTQALGRMMVKDPLKQELFWDCVEILQSNLDDFRIIVRTFDVLAENNIIFIEGLPS